MFAEAMQQQGIKPEMELYHPGMYWVFDFLRDLGLVEQPYIMQFVMGVQTGIYPTPQNLLSFVNQLPSGSVFTTAAMGPFQLPLTVMSILLGGHVRVGLEDNIYAKRGQLLRTNAEAVEQVVRIAHEMNREIATPRQAREILGLSSEPNEYS